MLPIKKSILVLALSTALLLPALSQAERFEHGASYEVCFTPGENCTQKIVDAIDSSANSIYVQAYSFTSRPIGRALVDAKERGVNVNIIFDKSTRDSNQGTLWYFAKHQIPIWIDTELGIAHNKVMVIDQTRVITGSFNFTRSAQERNAENVLIIDDNYLAQKYLQNWQNHQTTSKAFVFSPTAQPRENILVIFWHWLINFIKHLFSH